MLLQENFAKIEIASDAIFRHQIHMFCVVGVSLIAGLEYGMERWNGKWNGMVNVHNYS